jgi:hypothetical protein
MGFYIKGITCLSGLGIITTSNDFRIIVQPVGAIVPVYTNYVFTIKCNTNNGISYQWYKNSIKILNANTPSLSLFSVSLSDIGDYFCVVNNSSKSRTSNIASLSVLYPLTITKQPVRVLTNPKSTVTFDVDYTGSEVVNIEWYFNNTLLKGASSKSITITNADKVNEGNYYCKMSNYVSTVTSNVANLIIRTPLTITQQPTGGEVILNTEILLTGCVSGTAPINYYWIKDGIKVASSDGLFGSIFDGNISKCFTFYKIRNQLSDYGNYRLVAYNLVNSVTSNVAVVTKKIGPPTIVTDIYDISCEVGDNISFICSAIGDDPIYYQWCNSDNSPIVGATSSTYSINDVQLSAAKILYCKVTNIGGSVSSYNATLSVSSQYIVDSNNQYIVFSDNSYWKYSSL